MMDYEIGGMAMEVTLDRLPQGIPATVLQLSCKPELSRRLRDFGLVPGTKVRRRYASPGGHVMAIELRGSMLALRRNDLHRIRVRV